MTTTELYDFKSERFTAIEVLSEVYNRYYAEIAMSNIAEEKKKEYLDYIINEQPKISLSNIKTPDDLIVIKNNFSNFQKVMQEVVRGQRQ